MRTRAIAGCAHRRACGTRRASALRTHAAAVFTRHRACSACRSHAHTEHAWHSRRRAPRGAPQLLRVRTAYARRRRTLRATARGGRRQARQRAGWRGRCSTSAADEDALCNDHTVAGWLSRHGSGLQGQMCSVLARAVPVACAQHCARTLRRRASQRVWCLSPARTACTLLSPSRASARAAPVARTPP
eukprot:2071212-Pleurochrysis_carterae.AAC.1